MSTATRHEHHPMANAGFVPEPKKVNWVDSPNYRALCAILAPDYPRVAAWAFHEKECWAQVIQVDPPLVVLTEYPVDPNLKVRSICRTRADIEAAFHRINVYGNLHVEDV